MYVSELNALLIRMDPKVQKTAVYQSPSSRVKTYGIVNRYSADLSMNRRVKGLQGGGCNHDEEKVGR